MAMAEERIWELEGKLRKTPKSEEQSWGRGWEDWREQRKAGELLDHSSREKLCTFGTPAKDVVLKRREETMKARRWQKTKNCRYKAEKAIVTKRQPHQKLLSSIPNTPNFYIETQLPAYIRGWSFNTRLTMKQSPPGRDCSPQERFKDAGHPPPVSSKSLSRFPTLPSCCLPCEDATAGHRYRPGIQDGQPLDSELAGTFILDFSASTRTVRKQIPILINYSHGILLQQNTQFKKTTTQW